MIDPLFKSKKIRAPTGFNDKERRKTLKRHIKKRKEEIGGCLHCGESDLICLDFHHTDPTEKDLSISEAVRNRWTVGKTDEEIAKCILLCSNCHRKEHRRLRLLKIEQGSKLPL